MPVSRPDASHCDSFNRCSSIIHDCRRFVNQVFESFCLSLLLLVLISDPLLCDALVVRFSGPGPHARRTRTGGVGADLVERRTALAGAKRLASMRQAARSALRTCAAGTRFEIYSTWVDEQIITDYSTTAATLDRIHRAAATWTFGARIVATGVG